MENLFEAYLAAGISAAIMACYLVLIPALKQAKPSMGIAITYSILFAVTTVIGYPLVIYELFKDTKTCVKYTKNSIIRVINKT